MSNVCRFEPSFPFSGQAGNVIQNMDACRIEFENQRVCILNGNNFMFPACTLKKLNAWGTSVW